KGIESKLDTKPLSFAVSEAKAESVLNTGAKETPVIAKAEDSNSSNQQNDEQSDSDNQNKSAEPEVKVSSATTPAQEVKAETKSEPIVAALKAEVKSEAKADAPKAEVISNQPEVAKTITAP